MRAAHHAACKLLRRSSGRILRQSTAAELTRGVGFSSSAYFDSEDCVLADFTQIIDDGYASQSLDDLPCATSVEKGVVVYDCSTLELPSQGGSALEIEIARVLMDGCGIVVFKNAMDHAHVDAVSASFRKIIESASSHGGDHFAKAGANDRIWNALEKLAVTNPKVPAFRRACLASST